MKIKEAIDRVDKLVPNTFEEKQKVEWLSTLDKNIYKNVISTHKDAAVTSFSGYGDDTDIYETELLADDTFADMYIHYLAAQIDLYNRELNGYNNNVLLYDARYKEYAAWYNRTHLPINTAREVYF